MSLTAQAEVEQPVDEQVLLERQRSQAYVVFAETVGQARHALKEEVARVDALLVEVRQRSSELEVLVRRSPGMPLTRYHSATHPCRRVTGRGRTRENFELAPESAAQRRGVTRCTACDWAAAERAQRAK